ncbi:MAG: hypothetical protein E2600_14775 [Chryseobacterium sp.]|nr:hypothetical protein [Chryseobacterium sp.]
MSTANLTLLNNETNAVTRWSSMYNKAIEDRKILDILIKQGRVDAIVKYYTRATDTDMRNILESWDFETRWKFLDKVGAEDANFLAYKADTELLEHWKVFTKRQILQ